MHVRTLLSVLLATACTTSPVVADNSDKKLTDAEKDRMQAQVDSLKKQKLQDGQKHAQQTADMAKRKTEAVEQKRQQEHAYINETTKAHNWRIGPDAARAIGDAHKKAVDDAAEAEKAKINEAAQKKAAAHKAAAQKSADNVTQSVEGLKSQVSKDGKFGLQPKGSNLHVRNYGK